MEPWEIKLDAVLNSWVDTPFMPGQCVKRMGADCRFFVIGVLDELYGITEPRPPRIPQDTGVNNEDLSRAEIAAMMRRYPAEMFKLPPYLPGDALIVRPAGSDPKSHQHLMIAGPGDPMPIWHCGSRGVHKSSVIGWNVTKAFRMLEKHRW